MWAALAKGASVAYPILEPHVQRLVSGAFRTGTPASALASAHIVSELNKVLPVDRQCWIAEKLFIFIGAHARVERKTEENQAVAAWCYSETEIIARLLRGTTADESQYAKLSARLMVECEQVFAYLPIDAQHTRENAPLSEFQVDQDPVSASLGDDSRNAVLRVGRSAVSGFGSLLSKPGVLVNKARTKINDGAGDRKRRARDRKIVSRLQDALLGGGLSSYECRNILLMLGIDAAEIDTVMRTRVTFSEGP